MEGTEALVESPSRFKRGAKAVLAALALAWMSLAFWNTAKPLPPGTHSASQTTRLSEADVDFPLETSRLHEGLSQEMTAIDHAEQLVVVDQSPVTRELAQRLLARKRLRPTLKVVVLTDPAHEAFGGTASQTIASLEEAGIVVARIELDRLRDSNPLYSGLWRLVFGWWSDPFEEADREVTLPAWCRMQNLKSDHRQLVVADDGSGGWTGLIGPAPAVASLRLRGYLARAMVSDELEIARWSTDDDRLPAVPPMGSPGAGSIDARFLTEGAIEASLLEGLSAASSGDLIGIAAETLADSRLVAAALHAAARGAQLRVLLARDHLPNPAVAGELLRDGSGRIEIRWYADEEGAARPNLLFLRHRNDLWVSVGSANFTRRNLGDLNLAAAVELRMPARAPPARALADYFTQSWSSASAQADFADQSPLAYWRYRFAEATGLSAF